MEHPEGDVCLPDRGLGILQECLLYIQIEGNSPLNGIWMFLNPDISNPQKVSIVKEQGWTFSLVRVS